MLLAGVSCARSSPTLKLEEESMRFYFRRVKIDPELRKTFERYGEVTMQMLLATNATTYRHQGSLTTVELYLAPLLDWLTEQYARKETKETWSLMMEAAITIFVAAELFLPIIRSICGHSR
jgi:hypothetical protein